jgi:hypothetical protein
MQKVYKLIVLINPMAAIEIEGIGSLTEEEKKEAKKIIDRAYEKLKWGVKKDFLLRVIVKEYSKSGENFNKRKKYSIHAEISGPVQVIEASAVEWDFNKTLHMAMNKLIAEVEHLFR